VLFILVFLKDWCSRKAGAGRHTRSDTETRERPGWGQPPSPGRPTTVRRPRDRLPPLRPGGALPLWLRDLPTRHELPLLVVAAVVRGERLPGLPRWMAAAPIARCKWPARPSWPVVATASS